jgi:hypothetical protein
MHEYEEFVFTTLPFTSTVPGETPCQKARQKADSAAPQTGLFVPTCEADGSYTKKQCHASTGYCWCVDKDGVKIQETEVFSSEPQCDKKTKCQQEEEEANRRSEQGQRGHTIPSCEADGSYSSVQCHGSTGYCWCTTPEGIEKAGTRIQFSQPQCDTQTKCQQEMEKADRKSDRGMVGHFTPSCKADGSYSLVQCHGSSGYCWCATPKGKPVAGTETRGFPSQSHCYSAAVGKCEAIDQ